MKLIILGSISSIHVVRLANHFVSKDINVTVISISTSSFHSIDDRVSIYRFPYLGAFSYYLYFPFVKMLITLLRPDIVNAHYACGYGTLGRLVNFRPFVLSCWGSDVYNFPLISKFNYSLLKKNLLFSDVVASTSLCMAEQIRSFFNYKNTIEITPFGVDLSQFSFDRTKLVLNRSPNIVIGTVKSLNHIYGIDNLIYAFHLLNKRCPEYNLTLRIAGSGPQESFLRKVVADLNLSSKVEFVGHISNNLVCDFLSTLDIFACLSREESFGVSIIEAAAMHLPLVVSNAPGLSEIVDGNSVGLIVPIDDIQASCDALYSLTIDPDLRFSFGKNAYDLIMSNYSLDSTASGLISLYKKLL